MQLVLLLLFQLEAGPFWFFISCHECSSSLVAGRFYHAKRGRFSDCSPKSTHFNIRSHYRHGCSSLSLKHFSRLRIFVWLKFPLYLPTSLLLLLRNQAIICLKKLMIIKRNLTHFAMISTGYDLPHKVFVSLLATSSTQLAVFMLCPVLLVKYFRHHRFFIYLFILH